MKWFKKLLLVFVVLIVCLTLTGAWVLKRLVPEQAAEAPCREPSVNYRCLAIDGFELSTFQSSEDKNLPAVLVLHGGPGMSGVPLTQSLGFLAKDYRVYSYDQRGAGYSQIKSDLSLYDYPNLVSEVEAVRQTLVGDEKITIVGHSFGAFLALSYALAHNEHVEKLVLVSTPVPQASMESVVALLSNGVPPSDPLEANVWLESILANYFAPSFKNADALAAFKPGAASYATMIAASNSVIATPFDVDALSSVTQPVLMLYGDRELFNTGEPLQRFYQKRLPNAELVKLNESGHWSFLEQPQAFQQAVEQFLR